MAIYHVSGGGDALQTAINNYAAGSTLLVADGVYSRVQGSKSMTISSESGNPLCCIIDGGTKWANNEFGTTILTAGTRCVDSWGSQGNELCFHCMTIQNGCLLSGDGQSNNSYGGAAYGGTFISCIFQYNYCWKEGGAYIGGFQPTKYVDHCIFRYNKAETAGGGQRGGLSKNCIFHDNYGGTYGGGGTYVGITINSLYYNNQSAGPGAAIRSSKIYNCTIYGNHCTNSTNGYGVMLDNAQYSSIYNSIVYGNTTSLTSSGYDFRANSSNSAYPISVYNNCLPNITSIGTNVLSSNNINDNPIFADIALNDFSLLPGSKCIGTGNTNYLCTETDLNGNKWKNPPSIGAFEFFKNLNLNIPNYQHPIGDKTNKPYDRKIQWLSGDGNAYIDTGIIPELTDEVEINIPVMRSTGLNGLFGCCGTGWRLNAYGVYSWQFWLGNSYTSITSEHAGIYRIRNGILTLDGEQIANQIETTEGIPYRTLFLFALHDRNPHDYGKPPTYIYSNGAISSFKLKRGNVVLLDMYSVVKNNIGYMYDKISNKLFGNIGRGNFICG